MIEQTNPLGGAQYSNDSFIKIRNLEEKQRMLKDRLLLIGENLIDMREKNREEILGMKKDFEMMKRNVERLVDFLETASGEFSKFAKKEDLEIENNKLSKQNGSLQETITQMDSEIIGLKDKESKEITFLRGMVLHLTSKQEEIRDEKGIIRRFWKQAGDPVMIGGNQRW